MRADDTRQEDGDVEPIVVDVQPAAEVRDAARDFDAGVAVRHGGDGAQGELCHVGARLAVGLAVGLPRGAAGSDKLASI